MRIVYLDFEFNRVTEPKVNLVCCATYDLVEKKKIKWWLHNEPASQQKLTSYLKKFDAVIGYSTVAEARSYISLGIDPLGTKWIDLFIEYRMLTNHNDKLQWGKQLVDGKVKHTSKPRPKWQREEGESATGFRATHSLAEATYKLTGEIRDTKHKTAMRDLIISDPKSFTKEEREAIMQYCLDDVVFLPKMWERIKEEFFSLVPQYPKGDYLRDAFLRGRYSAHTAHMESIGYPIDFKKVKNFSKSVPAILYDIQKEINGLFPDIKPFAWDKKNLKFTWRQKATQDWIAKNCEVTRWMRTDGGALSLSLEAWERVFDFKHDYPENNFGAQMVRFLKLKQSIYGFSEGGKGKSFWDFVGSDKRVRPYLNHYGAQSSRSQPGASGFMFLKPAWMRAMVVPPKGKFIAGIDYGSQEFFVAGLSSRSKNMIDAYLSGDPYWYQAKLAKAVAQDAKKEDHKPLRYLFKSTTLAIQFMMTKFGLAIKLTNDTGKDWSEEEAQEQIEAFFDRFPEYKEWQEDLQSEYREGAAIQLPCGWFMFSDNENIRSVTNVPIQGFGASTMRKAVDLNHKRGGAQVIFTLHDALYIEGNIGEEYKIEILRDAMRDAFVSYCDEDMKQYAKEIRLDPFAWSQHYKRDSVLKLKTWEVPVSDLYVDERSIKDYGKFSKYFETPLEDLV